MHFLDFFPDNFLDFPVVFGSNPSGDSPSYALLWLPPSHTLHSPPRLRPNFVYPTIQPRRRH